MILGAVASNYPAGTTGGGGTLGTKYDNLSYLSISTYDIFIEFVNSADMYNFDSEYGSSSGDLVLNDNSGNLYQFTGSPGFIDYPYGPYVYRIPVSNYSSDITNIGPWEGSPEYVQLGTYGSGGGGGGSSGYTGPAMTDWFYWQNSYMNGATGMAWHFGSQANNQAFVDAVIAAGSPLTIRLNGNYSGSNVIVEFDPFYNNPSNWSVSQYDIFTSSGPVNVTSWSYGGLGDNSIEFI